MISFDNVRTRDKTLTRVGAALLGMVALFVAALMTLQGTMLSDRKAKTSR